MLTKRCLAGGADSIPIPSTMRQRLLAAPGSAKIGIGIGIVFAGVFAIDFNSALARARKLQRLHFRSRFRLR